jgi:hypothetical protein
MKELRIVLEDEVHAQLKEKARHEGRSIKSVIDELVDSYTKDRWGTLLKADMAVIDRLVSKVRGLEGRE